MLKLSEHMRSTMSELEALIKSHDPDSSPVKDSMDEETFKPDNYSVRKAISSDNWKIYQLMASFFPEDGDRQDESKPEFTESDLHEALFKPEPVTQAIVAIFKYRGQESLVGYCLYNFVKVDTQVDIPFLLIEDMFVHPAFRGARVSRHMLRSIKNNLVSVLQSCDDPYKILRWSTNEYEGRKVNFYDKYGAQLLAEFRRVITEEDQMQDTLTYDVFPSTLNRHSKSPPKKSRTLANLKLSTAHRPPILRSRCRSLAPE